ncbi:M48 family metalloprotease [Armatimonas sp.]|uniref:M48 family metalloprotease n=1 Tax=Armatimonas sp. TaxID=1872638 RepID=UPI00286CD585|nr:M48 family metalloprotease [Armatimonas sp.]
MKHPDTLTNEIEKLLGRATGDALIGASGIDDDPLLTRWVMRIGEEVAVHSDRLDTKPEFVILGSDVANALTLPGSKVLVTRGLLDEVTSDDELAGVLAHECGHIAKRHAWQQLQNNGLFALLLSLVRPKSEVVRQGVVVLNLLRALAQSRENEYQADDVGLKFATAAGYAPAGLLHFIQTMASGPMAKWEEYFATHPPGTKRNQRGREQSVVREADADSRAAVAAGFDRRGLSGLAEQVRQGQRDPLTLAPPTPRSGYLRDERRSLAEAASGQQKRLLATYKPLVTSSTLQQLLLLTAQSQDIRFIALSTHAYLLQFHIQDVYARSVRLLRLAMPVWEDLVPENSDRDTPDQARGRSEVQEAIRRVAGTPEPLQKASKAALLALSDLHLGRFYKLDSGAQWTRIAAIEGLIRYAESELSRADKAAGIGWRYLALARIRRYQCRLDRLVPEDDKTSRSLWQQLIEARLGQAVTGEGSTGEASVRAALATQRQVSETMVAKGRGSLLWADWVAQNQGIPENIATILRLLTLDMERELAARAYLRRKE